MGADGRDEAIAVPTRIRPVIKVLERRGGTPWRTILAAWERSCRFSDRKEGPVPGAPLPVTHIPLSPWRGVPFAIEFRSPSIAGTAIPAGRMEERGCRRITGPGNGSSPGESKRAMKNDRKVTPDQLIEEMHRTVDRLAEDGADRGDIKILARTLRELRHAFRLLSRYRCIPKVMVFGSARSLPGSAPYLQAMEFGRMMARNGWMVVTGGGEGIMEAAHIGSGQGFAMGINILLPFEQGDNRIIAGDPKLIHVKYFFTRKLLFVKESQGVALLPGGFGTMDEAFEVLTLLQTGKSGLFPIVLLDEPGGDYWSLWSEFVVGHLVRRGLISPEDLSLFRVTDDAEEAVREILGFYRVFHSMRYVGKELVIRLRDTLSGDFLSRIRKDFSDIVVSGTFRLGESLPDERNEPGISDLRRLIFRFNRKNFGRLRSLIDFINRESD